MRDLLFVYQQRRDSSFANAAAVVVEFNADDMIAYRKPLIGSNSELVVRLVRKCVGEDRLAVRHQQCPAAEAPLIVANTPFAPPRGMATSAAIVHDLFLKSGAEPSGMRIIPG
ncbi:MULTISPECIES: hypothetical protein [unclassified Bradyrhizobium]